MSRFHEKMRDYIASSRPYALRKDGRIVDRYFAEVARMKTRCTDCGAAISKRQLIVWHDKHGTFCPPCGDPRLRDQEAQLLDLEEVRTLLAITTRDESKVTP